MAQLQLRWPRDSDGYHLETTPAGSGRTILESHDEITWIVANRGRPQLVDAMKIHGLVRRLASWRRAQHHMLRPANAKGALDFVEKYGFLAAGYGTREAVGFIAHHITVARELVRVINRKDWPSLEKWAFDNAQAIRLHPTFAHIEDEDRSELFFEPSKLIDAIYIQALQDVANATQFETCGRPGCPEWFAVGPGTGRSRVKRPSGLRYCSQKCQKAHDYMKKKGISK